MLINSSQTLLTRRVNSRQLRQQYCTPTVSMKCAENAVLKSQTGGLSREPPELPQNVSSPPASCFIISEQESWEIRLAGRWGHISPADRFMMSIAPYFCPYRKANEKCTDIFTHVNFKNEKLMPNRPLLFFIGTQKKKKHLRVQHFRTGCSS